MTSIPPIVDEAEGFVRNLAGEFTRPRENECLCCYVARLLDDFPCDGTHRHAFRYRDTMAPRATALADRLSRMGACCCDCELFLNGYQPATRPSSRGRLVDDYASDAAFDDAAEAAFDALPPCAGVRRGSVQACRNWVRIRRWR